MTLQIRGHYKQTSYSLRTYPNKTNALTIKLSGLFDLKMLQDMSMLLEHSHYPINFGRDGMIFLERKLLSYSKINSVLTRWSRFTLHQSIYLSQ